MKATTLEEAAVALADGATVRAGATDLTERRHLGLSTGPLVDLHALDELRGIERSEDGVLRIGAMTPIATLATHPEVQTGWPGLAQTAGGLATPQIRARGTLGGNLLQDVRCWYYRSDRFTCLKEGGSTCLARAGDPQIHSCLDLGPCIAPHPSTLAMALLALDATVKLHTGASLTMPELLGAGTNPLRTHDLPDDALITEVLVPASPAGSRSGYLRTIQRSRAEWPLVEAFAQVTTDARDTVVTAQVAVGGVANRPLRLSAVERALVGQPLAEPSPQALAKSLENARVFAPQAWKASLIVPTLADLLATLAAQPAPATLEETP